ncbi:glycoside hydrolase [Thamnocephalis sphaerospora]|uniref:Trehalase n=1 Tax=Thamnocephalis sphaerospora TaxID=78915 RepID=A0A4P9XVC3_9FUNG|nr:glycoside hydrolase [Thamnocephalis sphaerospora]|eukprot:RKP09962.1 glycoside hydrolase [Thamnocephalis sphaerospora]
MLFTAVLALAGAVAVTAQHHNGCDVPLYCPGPLLDVIQSAKLHNDSKYFVDQPTSKPLNQVLAAFAQLPGQPTRDQVAKFVGDNFLPAGAEIGPAVLSDFRTEAPFLSKIRDPELRRFSQDVHSKWLSLGREYKPDVLCAGCASSVLPTKKPFVVPGGRFREFYYWDSYFTMEGLLISGMTETVKGMIENILDIVDEYGFMPNGARIYYLNRSQPPLLTQMVRLYVEATNDDVFLARALPTLEKEHAFWMKNRTVTVSAPGKPRARLAVYAVNNDQPRPESWREDKHTAANMADAQRKRFYAEMAAGAESGWDYSSRWFTQETALDSIATSQVVPVDLNSILYANERAIAHFSKRLGRNHVCTKYAVAADARRDAIHQYLWSEKDSQWYDFNLTSRQQNERFYASTVVPLWSHALDRRLFNSQTAARFVAAVRPALDMPGGAPTSLIKSGQQWDFPNAWPPLEHFVVYGLLNAKTPEARDLAKQLAQRWINSNYCGWLATGGNGKQPGRTGGLMFEKYDASRLGIPGDGGEYEVQEGFGWSNGVLLSFLTRLGTDLTAPKDCPPLPANFHF